MHRQFCSWSIECPGSVTLDTSTPEGTSVVCDGPHGHASTVALCPYGPCPHKTIAIPNNAVVGARYMCACDSELEVVSTTPVPQLRLV